MDFAFWYLFSPLFLSLLSSQVGLCLRLGMDHPDCHFGPGIFVSHFVFFSFLPFFFSSFATPNREIDEHGYGALINPHVLVAWVWESIVSYNFQSILLVTFFLFQVKENTGAGSIENS